MRKYEGIFIFPPEETPETCKEEEKRLEEKITRLGGRILERKDWGRRLLGYPLRKFHEGRILLWDFEMEPQQITEFRKVLGLDEKLLKATVVKTLLRKPVEEPPRRPRPPRPGAREVKEGTHARQPE